MFKEKSGENADDALKAAWPAMLETIGVMEATHSWPPQQLLDYGNEILASLKPGGIYVGGTDSGRFIPTLLNDTSADERHIVFTQNALADETYLDYVGFLYGDRLALPDKAERDAMFKKVVAAYGKPGPDGILQAGGVEAVMAVNELLLNSIRGKNPDFQYVMEESFSLPSTYAGAIPAGPIMALGNPADQNTLSAADARNVVNYWQQTAAQWLADPALSGFEDGLKTYSHMAVAQANLLASQNFQSEAEQASRLAQQLWPANPEATVSLAKALQQSGRAAEAEGMVNNYKSQYPEQASDLERLLAPPKQLHP